jgi:hypothetical protein
MEGMEGAGRGAAEGRLEEVDRVDGAVRGST